MNLPQQIGRYQIKMELGRGGMATVLLAHDPLFNRDVAIKVLPRQFTHDYTFRARFKQEAQAIAALEHAAIVPVYDFGEENEQPYLVMRYMRGGSLADRIAKGPIPLSEAAAIITRIAAGLDRAHSKNMIHRDLKPDNILFDEERRPYISDFGIVKLAGNSKAFTATASVIGTPAYMSPEQANGEGKLDNKSDIYALGVILFEMLTGQQPYKADTPIRVLYKHVTAPIPHITSVKQDLPLECETVVSRVLAKQPEDRYDTARELAAAVQTVAISKPLFSRFESDGDPKTALMPLYKDIGDYTKATIVDDAQLLSDSPAAEIPLTGQRAEKNGDTAVLAKRGLPRWIWRGGGIILFGLVLYLVFGNAGGNALLGSLPTETPTSTATSPATSTSEPTVTHTMIASPTAAASPTTTSTATASSTPPATSTATTTPTTLPTATSTVTPAPTARATNTVIAIPAPSLTSPAYGEYRSPVTFQWTSVAGATYQVTLIHDSGQTYTSGWIQGSQWTFDLPGDLYGNWQWFVTASNGAKSETSTFVFNPNPGAGSSGTNNPAPAPTSKPAPP